MIDLDDRHLGWSSFMCGSPSGRPTPRLIAASVRGNGPDPGRPTPDIIRATDAPIN
jgi:hypothetical protein